MIARFGRPAPWLVALAAIGAALLVVVAVTRWAVPSDEHAYWLAARHLVEGAPLYDPTATAVTPYAYWYPPVLAQVLAPVALVLPDLAFTAAWTVLLLACLWYLAGGRLLHALALVAFPPVAVELWFRNIHLVLAVIVVMAVRGGRRGRPDGWPWLWPVGAAIKLAPGLGIAWLLAQARWRAAGSAVVVGLAVLAVSVALSVGAWQDWIGIAVSRGPGDAASFVPLPYIVRAVAGLALALVAGRLQGRTGEVLLVVAITIALPTLWTTGLSLLVAAVPLWLDSVSGSGRAAEGLPAAAPPDRSPPTRATG